MIIVDILLFVRAEHLREADRLLCHSSFYIVRLDREPVWSGPAGTISCHEHIVLEAYASEVVVFFELVVIDESLVEFFALPLLYQSWNEIYSRLICNHVAGHELAGHPEAAQAKLGRALLVRIIAHQILSEVFHVVDVQAHVVSQAVRLEQAGDTLSNHVVKVATYDVQGPEVLEHQPGYGEMDVPVGNSGLSQLESQLVAVADYLVDVPLFLGELTGSGICPGEVGCVVHVVLSTCVDHHQLARLYHLVVEVVVECLPVLGQDGGEGHSPAFCKHTGLHLSDDLLFYDSDLDENNFATNIHPALIEAAKIDGAGEWYIYFKVILPLSLPILATIGLMVGLGYWNDWANGLYYITDEKLYSLQQLLKSIIDNIKNIQTISQAGAAAAKLPGTSIRMAMAVVGVIPVMILYPFFQKAFIAGISLGGVKE